MFNTKNSELIRVELVKLLYQQITFALWAESLAAIALAIALWNAVSTPLLMSWLSFTLLFSCLARYILVLSFKKSSLNRGLDHNKIRFWLIMFALGAFISGISWGAAGSILMVKHDMVRQTVTVFLLMGVTAAANPFYSPYRWVYALFLLPAFVPFAVWLFLQGGIFVILSILAIIYIASMLATSFYTYNLISTSLDLRFENRDLVDNISKAMKVVESKSLESEKTLSLVKATLESTTDGILVVNSNNEIVDYNQRFLEMWKIPSALIEKTKQDKTLLDFVCNQLIDPVAFKEVIAELYKNEEAESFEELQFKDGRIFERYSKPQKIANKSVGRVWSFRDVTRRKQMEQKLYTQANYDSLTGLPNRVLVIDRISQAILNAKRMKTILPIMFIDLDRFKLINDTLGHAFGDKLLVAMAKRLTENAKESDTVGRLGGDEFLFIINYLTNNDEVIKIARSTLEVISKPITIDNNKITCTVSVGISLYGKDGTDAETLIRNADIAMYRAKELGRNTFQFFTEEMNEKVLIRVRQENQLRNAMERKEFSLVYQPIINLHSGKISGLEALLRWHNQELGFINPSEFIPIAEDSGLIIHIGEWVLKSACEQTKYWHDQGFSKLQVAVNLSPRQFKQADLLDRIQRIILDTGLDPSCLTIELTESAIMDDIYKNIQFLDGIKRMGVCLALDDFGTGYSSLNYLQQLPLDKLKIDQSFIKNIPHDTSNAAITSAIISLAKNLKLQVLAEGIENQEQLDFLVEQGCHEIQGFYFSLPLEIDQLTELLNEDRNFLK